MIDALVASDLDLLVEIAAPSSSNVRADSARAALIPDRRYCYSQRLRLIQSSRRRAERNRKRCCRPDHPTDRAAESHHIGLNGALSFQENLCGYTGTTTTGRCKTLPGTAHKADRLAHLISGEHNDDRRSSVACPHLPVKTVVAVRTGMQHPW